MVKTGKILLAIFFVVNITQGQSRIHSVSRYDLKSINSKISNDWAAEVTNNKDLPYPYVTAFSHDQHMFYWDTYFINKGLLATNNLKLAKQNVLNVLYVVDRFGYMGNAAITSWGMNRSQPPYLSVMVRDVYDVEKDAEFLRFAYPILKKEYHFWTDTRSSAIEDHSTSIVGLQRFGHHAAKKELVDLYNEIAGRLNLKKDLSDEQKSQIASNYAAEAESGMDFTLRFENRCPEFVAVDLNSLLYCLEINLGWMSAELKLSNEPQWNKIAKRRKDLINYYCWDEKSGLYYDYDFISGRKSKVVAVTTFEPLWAGMASRHQAQKVISNLQYFETPYGLTTTGKGSNDKGYQWGSSSIWAPMQLIAVDGMLNYGFTKDAKRIADRYLNLIAENYYLPKSSINDLPVIRKTGTVYEKYKYDGTINDDEYVANKMMGWTAAVFNYLYKRSYDF